MVEKSLSNRSDMKGKRQYWRPNVHYFAIILRRGQVCSCGFRISAASEQAGRCGPGTG